MNAQEALHLVNELLHSAKQPRLNDIQSFILLGTWEGCSYQVLADRLSYEVDYIKQIGARLWKLIAQIIDEDVSKSNLQSVLQRYQHIHKIQLPIKIQDWGEAIDVSHFYGRQDVLQTLETWILDTRCRLIGIFGLGGIGKTALSVKLAQQVQSQFAVTIWRSLRQTPPLDVLLSEVLSLINLEIEEISLAGLLEQMRLKRCLLVLDNVESILYPGNRSGEYQPGYKAYAQLFEQACDQPHQSCLLLTGREKPHEIAIREGQALFVRSLQLQGLPAKDSQQILRDKGLATTPPQTQALVNYLGGNPLALKIVATTVQTLFGSDIQAFLTQNSKIFSSLWDLLEEQFERLLPLQQQVMYWLAINREGVTPEKLVNEMIPKVPLRTVLEVLEVLLERSLIETVQAMSLERTETSLSQQPVVMEYVTERLLQIVEQEIINAELHLFRTHALIEAQTQDYLRTTQIQLILNPLIERLLTHFETQTNLERHLAKILADLRQGTQAQTGYAVGNLLNLFCYLKTNLNGFDFSHLEIRQAYLHNVTLYDTDFTGANIRQTVFAETFGGVVSVAFSPDGKYLATSDTRGNIQIWHAHTTGLHVLCRGHQHWTWGVVFSPDGHYLASASDDYRVKLWEVATGQCVQTFTGHTYSVNGICFSPNGQMLATCGQDATIRLWQVFPRKLNPELQILMGHRERVWAIAFTPNGQMLASGGEDGSIRLWDLETGVCRWVWQAHDHWVRTIAISPNGQYLASGSYDQTIKLWDIATQNCIYTLCGHRQPVSAIAFSPDGQQLASSSFDRTLKLWSITTGECLQTFLGHTNRVWSVAYHPKGQQIVSGGDDHATKFWHLKTGRCTKTLIGHTNAVLSLALSPDGIYLASGHEDQTIRVWEFNSGRIVKTLQEHTNRVWSVAFQPTHSSSILVSGSADYSIKLWDWQAGNCLQTLQGHRSWVWTVAFHPNGQLLASSSYDHTIKLWDLATGECLKTLQEHTSPVVSVAFSSCGQLLASSEFKGTVKLWNVETGECYRTIAAHSNSTWSVSFSANGEWLLSSSFDHTLKLWSVTTGECLQTLIGHQGPVSTARFSPDDQWIISGSLDRTLKVWQTSTGNCHQTLVGHSDLIFTVLLTSMQPDETNTFTLRAVSSSLDESIKIWDLKTQTCLSTWRVPRPYEGMKIRGLQGLSEAQRMTLIALGAVE